MSVSEGERIAIRKKRNVVLYLDNELVEKSKELGVNLSKTCENHLKHILIQFSTENSLINLESSCKLKLGIVAGGEGFEPSTPNLGGWCSIRTEHRERVWLGPLYSPKFPVQQFT